MDYSYSFGHAQKLISATVTALGGNPRELMIQRIRL